MFERKNRFPHPPFPHPRRHRVLPQWDIHPEKVLLRLRYAVNPSLRSTLKDVVFKINFPLPKLPGGATEILKCEGKADGGSTFRWVEAEQRMEWSVPLLPPDAPSGKLLVRFRTATAIKAPPIVVSFASEPGKASKASNVDVGGTDGSVPMTHVERLLRTGVYSIEHSEESA